MMREKNRKGLPGKRRKGEGSDPGVCYRGKADTGEKVYVKKTRSVVGM